MALVELYPQAILDGNAWTYVLEVDGTQFVHPALPAGVTVTVPLVLHKIVLRVDIGTATLGDVDDALFVDDIRPGPQTETVWANWQTLAEGIIAGLGGDPTADMFWAAWGPGDTAQTRQDIQRALETGPGGIGRGWTITGFHQHEGDGTVLEQGIG